MDYMRQTKINKLQSEINELKDTPACDAACNFVYEHIKWFYDNWEELPREIINADMIYEKTEAQSHSEYNYICNIILELKKNYVFICYDYDYSHDSYTTRFAVTKDKLTHFNIMEVTEKFVNDTLKYDEKIKTEYQGEIDRCDMNRDTIKDDVIECNDNLSKITNLFVKKLIIGLSYTSYWYQIPIDEQAELHKLLTCKESNEEESAEEDEESAEEDEESAEEEEESADEEEPSGE